MYLKSYNLLEIIPLIHRNTVAFIGMKLREEYIAAKMVKDWFIALDKENNLSTWSLLTGKLLNQINIAEFDRDLDFSEYDLYAYDDEDFWPQDEAAPDHRRR